MALDDRGVYLSEVKTKYPREFQTLGYDVLFDTDEMYKPKVISTFEMCVNAILTLLKMKPGQYPSIPELGIDVEQYLHEYSDDPKIALTIQRQLSEQLAALDYIGINIQVFNDKFADGQSALIVKITGTETLTYHMKIEDVVIGITYDKLGQMYTRVKYNELNTI